jgi:voltage-gated sodium channel
MSDMHGNTSRFEHAVTAVILANSVVMLWGLLDHSREELLENVDLAFLWFFASELAVRLWRARLGFFHSPWSCFDAAIIVLALLPVLGGGIAVLRMARLARASHLLRHVTHLRLWRLFALPS